MDFEIDYYYTKYFEFIQNDFSRNRSRSELGKIYTSHAICKYAKQSGNN